MYAKTNLPVQTQVGDGNSTHYPSLQPILCQCCDATAVPGDKDNTA